VFVMCMIVMILLHLQLASRMAVTDAQLHSLATITNIHLGRLEKLMEGKREKEEIEEMMLLAVESTEKGRSQKRTHKIECLVNRLLEELEHKSRERRHSSDTSASQRRRSSDTSASQRRRSSDASGSKAKRSTHHTAAVAKPPAVSIPWTCSDSKELEPPPEFSSSELDELLGLHRAGSAHPLDSNLPPQQLTVDEALKMLNLTSSGTHASRSSPASPVKRLPTDNSRGSLPRRRFSETDKEKKKENKMTEELGPAALNSKVRCLELQGTLDSCPVEVQSRFAEWFLHKPSENTKDLGFTRSFSANPQEHSKNNLISETRQHSARDYREYTDMDRFAGKRATQEVPKKHPSLETVKKDAKDVKISRSVSDGASSSRHVSSFPNRLSHISSGSAFYSNVIAQQAGTSNKGTNRLPARIQTESRTLRAASHQHTAQAVQITRSKSHEHNASYPSH